MRDGLLIVPLRSRVKLPVFGKNDAGAANDDDGGGYSTTVAQRAALSTHFDPRAHPHPRRPCSRPRPQRTTTPYAHPT